ncbi:MAG: hypothetical protein AAGG72_10080 [Pseudomonadota bacterium]
MTIRGKKVVWASITWFAASVFVASVNADDAELESANSRYQMAAVIDRARGNAVMAGDYQKAIAKLDSRGLKCFEASTNLCVAYTMTGELEKADQACAAALMLSKKSEERRDMAVALSNLGVVKAIGGDHRGAREDFSRALELNAGLQQASENLQRLRDGDA